MLRRFLCLSAFICLASAAASAQLVVETRPQAPANHRQVDAPRDETMVLLPASWAVKGGEYVYVQARYERNRPDMKYVAGKWKKVSGGWTWRPGYWK